MQSAASHNLRSEGPIGAPVSARGLVVAAIIAAVAAGVMLGWPVTGGSGETGAGITIVMGDYSFAPDRLTWRVGETVTITVRNETPSQLGRGHEIMFGRGPLLEEGVLGPVQGDGFEEQLLDGATIELLAGNGVSMIMAETVRLTGVDPMTLMPSDMDMAAEAMRPGMDFMAVLEARGSLTFRFQVPDRPGEWEFGCFAQDGQHYRNGMRGTVTVTAP